MKNKLSMLMVVLFLVAIGVSGAFAYDITITPGGTQDVTGQSTIYFDIVFNPDSGGNTLGTYLFQVGYDTGELTWNSGNTTTYPPAGYFEINSVVENTSGLIENFNAASFASDISLNSPYTLATVAFDIAPGINNPADGLPDVWFDSSQGTAEFTIDSGAVPLSQMAISGVGPDVYVLPEPISMILFVAGGATFGIGSYWRKRKQKLA